MSKLLTVVGATGTQGGSVVNAALKSGAYKVRGITRNAESAASKELIKRGVEMVTADTNDENSLVQAFEGSHAVFAVTDFFNSFATHDAEESMRIEAQQGINIAKAASKTASLKHFIWSTLPDSAKISGGKFFVPHFEGKAQVEKFIRADKDLLAKTTFLMVAYYGTNLVMPVLTPTLLKSSGKYIQLLPVPEDAPIVITGDPRINTGLFALAILDQPQLTLPGKYVLSETETKTVHEIVKLWSEVAGKPAEYVEISLDHYDNLWPKWGREVGIMLQFWNWAREKSWAADGPVLTKEDLKVSGLVGMKETVRTQFGPGVSD